VIDEAASPYSPPKANLEGGVALPGDLAAASSGSRLAAVFIDGLLFLPAAILGGIISFMLRATPGEPPPSPGVGAIVGGVLAGAYVLALAIAQIVFLSTRGQTIGKRTMKIRIIRLDGSAPGFVHAVLLRVIVNALPSAIPIVGSLYGLIDILFIFRRDQRCIHDHIAGTRVVVAPPVA
jgi:uncharacterized RDD family membrane protein YckC